MSIDVSLAERTAVVSGASSGIGRAIAERLGGAGATVYLAGRTQEPMEESVAAIARAGGRGEALSFDVRDGDALRDLIAKLLAEAGVTGQYAVKGSSRGLEVHPYRCGKMRILALHRNYQLRVSELGPPKYRTQKALEGPRKLTVDVGARFAVYNLRTGKYLGKRRNVSGSVPRHGPVLLTILPEPVEGLDITAAPAAKPGQLVKVKLKLRGKALGDTHAFRVRVVGPDGKELRVLTRTLAAPKGAVVWELPIAVSDPAGKYTLHARDIATGVSAKRKLTVRPK